MTCTIDCQTLTLALDDRGRVVSLRHRESGYEFLSAQAHPVGLWQLGLIRPVSYNDPLPPIRIPDVKYEGHEWWANRDEYRADLELDSDDAPAPTLRDEGPVLELSWLLRIPDGPAVITVGIEGGKRDRLEFKFQVSLPKSWALKRVTFPRVRGLGDPGTPTEDALLYPETWGVLRRNPLEDMTNYSGQYPAHINWCQMAAWLHGNHGLYVGMLDPASSHTGIDMQYVEGAKPAPLETDRRCLHSDTPAPDVGVSLAEARSTLVVRLAAGVQPAMQVRCHHWPAMASEWSCPYPVVLQGFSGDWYAAAQIHRQWATKQRWCRRGRLSERRDASSALAGVDLWFSKYGFHPGSFEPKPAWDFQKAMHDLQDFFQMPFGVHWYHWHNFSWHSNFPGHEPVVEGFEEVLKDLQQRGIVVMPYCQGRLLYRDRPGLETERAHTCVETNGQPSLEKYTPQDDWPLALCPSDAWSREQWVKAARMLWERYGVDGVYFDQITAMMPSLCYHAGHGHPLGGGTHWWEGYDRALADMAPMVKDNPRRFLSSELMADAYLDRIDLYLSFVPIIEDFVPLHPAIYGGYTTVMGRATSDVVLKDLQLFALCHGEQLLFGGQLGWVNEDILKYPEAAAYLRDLARLRSRVREFLHYGTLEAPLEITQDTRIHVSFPPALTGKLQPIAIDRPAVRHTVWRAPDGRLLIVLLNESRETAPIRFSLPPGNWRLWKLGQNAAENVKGTKNLSLTIPGLTVMAMESELSAVTLDRIVAGAALP